MRPLAEPTHFFLVALFRNSSLLLFLLIFVIAIATKLNPELLAHFRKSRYHTRVYTLTADKLIYLISMRLARVVSFHFNISEMTAKGVKKKIHMSIERNLSPSRGLVFSLSCTNLAQTIFS